MGQYLSNPQQIIIFFSLLFTSKGISEMKVKEVSILDRFQLQNVRLKSSVLNPHQEIVLQKQSSSPLSKERVPNLVVLSLKVTISEALNNCLKSKAIVCTVWLNSFCICLFLHTKQGEYCFDEMNYYMFAETATNTLNEVTQIEVESVDYSFKKTVIGLKISYNRKGNPFPELQELNQIILETGFRDLASYIRGQITEFRLQTIYSSEPLPSSAKCQNKFYFIDKEYSSPIGAISSIGQIYMNLGLKKLEPVQIDKLIAQLPHFSSPMQKQGRLYLCHDMKNGYSEDINFENNISLNSKLQNFEYRNFYLEQSNIFNYFSHHNITIPPKHWRIACKRYQTKCLGTFIIEHPVFLEQVLTSPEFALFLVAIAKKVQFDGYLINIQTKITNIIAFKKWLDYLTRKMHEHIPNSQVVWYDSISAVDGVIRYQNALNSVNKQFYTLTDGIFTNYWWNEQSLKTSINNKDPGKNIYIGNDCFGRNTYGGGKYDIYKAASKILEYKKDLQIALFAPGFTYQDNAENNRILYQLNELSMYKGLKTQTIIIDKWRDIVNRGNGWGQEGDWAVTSYDVCERSAYFKFQALQANTQVKVQFMYNIKGTPPINQSPYKVIIIVLDQNNVVVAQTEANNFSNPQKTPQKQETRSIQITVDAQDLVGPFTVRVIEMGKSSQQWAGQYGPRFKSQMVMVMIYEKQKHWIPKIPITQQVIGKAWQSSFNMGYGDSFFYEGIARQNKYGYLADFDHPHTHIINHPLDTDFNYKQVFLGGSSLQVKVQSINLLKLIIPKDIDLSPQYLLQVTVKNTPKIELTFKYISKLEEERVFQAAFHNLEEINGWKRFTFKMGTSIKQVKQDIRSILELRSIQYPYLLGEVKIVPVRLAEPAKVEVQVFLSRDYFATVSYYLNFIFKSYGYQRLLLKTDNFAAYAYFTNGTAYLRNIPFNKNQPIEFDIIDTDLSLGHRVLRTATIDHKLISQGNLTKNLQI